MRHRLEYLPVRLLAALVGALPRSLARAFGITLGLLAYALYKRDAVFILGQAFSFFVYARNLYFELRDRRRERKVHA